MEPTDAECGTIVDLRSLLDWAEVATAGGFRDSLLDALGNPIALRDIGSISGAEYETLVLGLMITPPAGAQAPAGVATMASAILRGRTRLGATRTMSATSRRTWANTTRGYGTVP
jgi:hypothetical protein